MTPDYDILADAVSVIAEKEARETQLRYINLPIEIARDVISPTIICGLILRNEANPPLESWQTMYTLATRWYPTHLGIAETQPSEVLLPISERELAIWIKTIQEAQQDQPDFRQAFANQDIDIQLAGGFFYYAFTDQTGMPITDPDVEQIVSAWAATIEDEE